MPPGATDARLAAIQALLRANRLDDADVLCRQAAADDAGPDLLNYRGIIAMKRGCAEEAVGLLRAAAAAAPSRADLLSNLGAAQRAAGNAEGAEDSYREALRLEPARAEVAYNLGNLLKDRGESTAARTAYRWALAHKPDYARALYNLGVLEQDSRNLDAAVLHYRQALVLAGGRYPDAALNLGMSLQKLGRSEEAVASYECVLAAEPHNAKARWNRGLANLLAGRLTEGWADYEARWSLDEMRLPSYAQPLWQGESLVGRRLLVEAEQGHGDTLQFVRYLPELIARGAQVILRCQAPLVRLLAAAFPQVLVIPMGTTPPSFDLHVPLMSLPHRLGTELDTIPAPLSYLHPLPDVPTAPLPEGGLSVGLVWGGEPNHKGDAQRSIPLSMLRPLFTVPGVRWFSLQKGARERELRALDAPAEIVDLAPSIRDFADTAAHVATLHLVVTVDTAVAHLAGALGRPAWVLLPFAPDWRWLLKRSDSPWYPTLTLFRQTARDDWAGVIASVTARLTALAETYPASLDTGSA